MEVLVSLKPIWRIKRLLAISKFSVLTINHLNWLKEFSCHSYCVENFPEIKGFGHERAKAYIALLGLLLGHIN